MYNDSLYYEKKTLVTVNSNDRIKDNKLITKINPNKVDNNGFTIIDLDTILVSHTNHNFDMTNSNEVIFKNIEGTYNSNLNKYTLGGIPVEFLNYNSTSGKPIFNIELVYTYENNIKISNSYKIKIPINIDKKFLVINGFGGGSNISVELVDTFIRGYEDASMYKISLPRRFTNIKDVKLVSLEMNNAQYAIRDPISKKYNNTSDYINHNNFIHWINDDDHTQIKSNFLINNEKLLAIINNDTNNIPIDWIKNNTKEQILFTYLSSMYLKKINTNIESIQYNFINMLYFLKQQINTSNNLSQANKDIINNEESYLLHFINESITYKLHLYDRFYTTNLDPNINLIKYVDRNITYTFNISNINNLISFNILYDLSSNTDYNSNNVTSTIINDEINTNYITSAEIKITIPNTEIIMNNNLFITYTVEDINTNTNTTHTIATLNINNTSTIRYYINDFYNKDILMDFVFKFTNYNFTTNLYNLDLNINFDETITYDETSLLNKTSVNIYKYLEYLTLDKYTNDPDNKLFFNFISNNNINLEYTYIKYLFNKNISLLIKEFSEYNYSNVSNLKILQNYQNIFINYLIDLQNVINSQLNELQRTIISYGYLVSYLHNNTIYRLYFYNKPIDITQTTTTSENIKNYNINDMKDLSKFTEFIKNYIKENINYDLSYKNYVENYQITNNLVENKIEYTITHVASTISIFNNNNYILPKTSFILDNTHENIVLEIFRNVTYVFDISNISDKLKVSSSFGDQSLIIDYNFNNNIINNNSKIEIKISNYENINNLYIINDTSTNNKKIVTLKIKNVNNYKSDFSIYGYLHNLTNISQIVYSYNNNNVNHTFINDSFKNQIKKIVIELNKNEAESYNLLANNTPNIDNQFYWLLPNKLNTNIYTSAINKNIFIDSMIENKYNYTDIMNIKYIMKNVDIYNLYPINSVQIKKGNYMLEDFVIELEEKLNSVSRKIYNYKEKIFKENTKYNNKTSLKIEKEKPVFKVDINESNNLVQIIQYKTLHSYSLLDMKEDNQVGPFIINEGYPYIFVKYKNHTLKTGDIININGASDIFNIPVSMINKNHIIYTNKIYRGYIRFILPLDNFTGTNTTTYTNQLDTSYFLEGTDFIQYTNYMYGLTKINNINGEIKNHIGNNTKNALLDYDISIYELFTDINNLDIEVKHSTKLGRVLNIISDENNNYIIDYCLESNNNFNVGDVIKTNTNNTYAIFIPNNWDKDYLPKQYDIINSNIELIKNVHEGFSIKIDVLPNQSSLEGTGGININILQATPFSILFDKDNTLNEALGFEKKMTDFNLVHSNTYNINENIIDYSYIEPSYLVNQNNNNKYIMLKTLINHNYNIGSIIHINNHYLNYNYVNSFIKTRLHIKEYVPFIVWFNDLPIIEQVNIKNNLDNINSNTFDNYCKQGIIIYYKYPYTKKQIQHLGNIGMPISSYENIDYFNYKESPIPNIYNLKPNSYIFINDHQKSINRIINGANITYKIGLRDGYYKVLNNIPIYKNSYYKNYFNNTNCAIIECNYITINESNNSNTIEYSEIINTSSKESVLEGFLNNGEILASTMETNIVGNIDSTHNQLNNVNNNYSTNSENNLSTNTNNYNSTNNLSSSTNNVTNNINSTNNYNSTNNKYDTYTTVFLKKIADNKINVFYPINCSSYFYLHNNNNTYFTNNNDINTLDLYENINYTIDLSDISLLNKSIIVSKNNYNILPFNSDNNNTANIIGLPGNPNSYADIKITSNISRLYLYIDYLLVITINIYELKNKVYNVILLDNNNFEFFDTQTTNILINPIFEIMFGCKYKFQFSDVNTYNNFLLINKLIYNTRLENEFITYNNTHLYIEILLTNNNYNDAIYYQLNNTEKTLGKFVLGIYNYYNTDRMVLCNSIFINNTTNILLDNTYKNIETNIINYIENTYNYYFTIVFKNNINVINNSSFIIPHVNISYLHNDTKQNTNKIRIKNIYDVLIIKEIKQNVIFLKNSNYNLFINSIVILKNNIPNTLLKRNSRFYVLSINNNYSEITLGDIVTKELIVIQDSSTFNNTIELHLYTSNNYEFANQLINKSIKINYLESYENLTNITYNSQISKINNNINNINISSKAYYNNISNNVTIINTKKIENLKWTCPHGTIYIDLNQSNIINYIKFNIKNTTDNNNPYKLYLYYIENNIIHYISSINNVNNQSILENVISKKQYIIYIESYGLYNNTYSELHISNMEFGYINPIKNDILLLDSYISRLAINNIVNKYFITDNYLDTNTVNDTSSLLLNNHKSSIIEINFDTPTILTYYNIIQNINDNSIIIGNSRYITNFIGTITSIELYGSNNIDFSSETQIHVNKFNSIVNTTVDNDIDNNLLVVNNSKIINYTSTFENINAYQYYRFKLLSNLNYYPYLKPVDNVSLQIEDKNNTIYFGNNNIPDDYVFSLSLNTNDITKNTFNFNISGIVVGNYKMVDYSKLYIEDINYITNAIITDTYIELDLKYNLLNSHLNGENVIISSSRTSENLFSTQNLILYNKWYTRIFYQGYNSIYNNNHISKTEYISTNIYNLLNKSVNFKIFSNSEYIFKHTSVIRLYEVVEQSDKVITSINEINYSNYNIDNLIFNTYETYIYTKIKTRNINLKYLNYIYSNPSIKLLLLPVDDYNSIKEELNINSSVMLDGNSGTLYNYKYITLCKNNNKEGLPILQDYLTNYIHIENMNGFYIIEDNYKFVDNNIVKTSSNNIITPLKNNNYNTYTYTYLDLIFKSDIECVNIDLNDSNNSNNSNNLYVNGTPIFGVFNNVNNLNSNSTNNDLFEYIDTFGNNNYFVNYHSITIEGKYLGYGGKINNKTNNTNNLFNNTLQGFKIIDIGYDTNNNKNLIKLDLTLSDLGIDSPNIYLGDINSIVDYTKKNQYIIGYGGNIFEKNIYRNIDAISGPKYLYLSINKLNNVLTTNNTSYFTKIMLKSTPGTHLYENEFTNNNILFEKQPLDELNELEIKFINDENKLFDLGQTEHSMVLEITEYVKDFDNSNYLH